jgi:hypothetical protein
MHTAKNSGIVCQRIDALITTNRLPAQETANKKTKHESTLVAIVKRSATDGAKSSFPLSCTDSALSENMEQTTQLKGRDKYKKERKVGEGKFELLQTRCEHCVTQDLQKREIAYY